MTTENHNSYDSGKAWKLPRMLPILLALGLPLGVVSTRAWMCLIPGSPAYASVGMTPSPSAESGPTPAGSSNGTAQTEENSLVRMWQQKLVHRDVILGEFEKGNERVKVIVNLIEPTTRLTEPTPGHVLKAEVIRRYKERLDRRHAEVAVLQSPVLSALVEREFRLRHRFDNWASFAGEVTLEGLAKLTADPLVESIEFDYPMKRLTKQGIPLMHGSEVRTTYSGRGVAIAIVDDGIDYRHPELGGSRFPNSKVIGGYDVADKDSDPGPDLTLVDCAHGTNCAGIAAGDIPQGADVEPAGDYIGGVACSAKLYAVKVFSRHRGDIYDSDVIAAWDWCINHKSDNPANPILVISVSLGQDPALVPTDNYTASARKATDVVRAGITLVAAAGNSGWCNSLEWPACLRDVISVGAVYDTAFGSAQWAVDAACCAPKTWDRIDETWYADDTSAADKVAVYSNVASTLDLFAPSNDASTTDVVGSPGETLSNYMPDFGGTSASSPYAAGAVACLQSAAYAHSGQYLSPALVRDILARTGDPRTDPKAPTITKPRINLSKAVEEVLTDRATTIVPLYRFWSPVLGHHFYTIDEPERNKLLDDYPQVWTYEGTAYHALSNGGLPGSLPVYRFWSQALGAHFFTISEVEKDRLINDAPFKFFWAFEGAVFHAWPEGSQPSDASPVYRFWSAALGSHFYTMSTAERDKLINQPYLWTYEGVAWYADK